MKRLLVTGVRLPNSDQFQFTVYGPAESRFPPAEVQMTLGEFHRWINRSETPKQLPKGVRQLPLLRCVSGKGGETHR